MVAMLVRINHQIDIAHLHADMAQSALEHREVLVRTGIDHDVHVVALDDVTVAAAAKSAYLKYSRIELSDRIRAFHFD